MKPVYLFALGVGSSLVEVRVVTEAEKVSDNTIIALNQLVAIGEIGFKGYRCKTMLVVERLLPSLN